MTFEQLDLTEPILRALEDKQYTTPTPIQQQAIPAASQGRDVLGTAQTGTGKTAAFAIPIIRQLDAVAPKDRDRSIKALIVTPTRELAIQIDDCFGEYAKYTTLSHAVIFGGVGQQPQTDALRRGVDILTATPGRLLDLIGQGHISLKQVRHFVLDEADRMLDMGFIHDIKRLLPLLPQRKQTLFFSATMPDTIDKLAKSILHDPVRVAVAPVSSVVETIDQQIYFVEKAEKKDLLVWLLRERNAGSTLIFSRTKHGADRIARIVTKAGIGCEALHGDKSQGARQRALGNFKSGKTHVIVATDIAARGIDIDSLELVINYDLPDVAETYVHRIGRTGRAGNTGTALSFCASEERDMLNDIQKLTGRKLPVGQAPKSLTSQVTPPEPAAPEASAASRTSNPASGRTSGRGSGRTSDRASGRTSGQTSDQAPNRASGRTASAKPNTPEKQASRASSADPASRNNSRRRSRHRGKPQAER